MPLYKFKCKLCNHEQENIAKLDQTKTTCDDCGGDSIKIFSANRSGFKVMGGGAYDSNKYKV